MGNREKPPTASIGLHCKTRFSMGEMQNKTSFLQILGVFLGEGLPIEWTDWETWFFKIFDKKEFETHIFIYKIT